MPSMFCPFISRIEARQRHNIQAASLRPDLVTTGPRSELRISAGLLSVTPLEYLCEQCSKFLQTIGRNDLSLGTVTPLSSSRSSNVYQP
jgi:hypothetical protein